MRMDLRWLFICENVSGSRLAKCHVERKPATLCCAVIQGEEWLGVLGSVDGRMREEVEVLEIFGRCDGDAFWCRRIRVFETSHGARLSIAKVKPTGRPSTRGLTSPRNTR